VALDLEDLEESELGFKATIRHSKTDQAGAGQTIAIVRGSAACPVYALKAWLKAADITAGPIFRSVKKGGAAAGRLSAQSVAEIVKVYAERVGLYPALFAAQSSRGGSMSPSKAPEVDRHGAVLQRDRPRLLSYGGQLGRAPDIRELGVSDRAPATERPRRNSRLGHAGADRESWDRRNRQASADCS
jgi:hypothetical protein